jgi:homoserine O-acetyltransferase
LEDGGVAYSLTGSRTGAPVIVLGGITATRTPADIDETRPGWWRDIVRVNGAIDLNTRRVISVDFLGGCGASARPDQSASPEHGGISTQDQARALAALIAYLGIDTPLEVIGASYGGMVAMQLAALRPDLVSRLLVISAAHRTHPMATALRSLQRRVLDMGRQVGDPGRGVAIARGIGMTTYRTAQEFEDRFEHSPDWGASGPRFEVEDYLETQGKKAALGLHPEGLRCLSESADTHALSPEEITVPTVAVAIDGDTLVPPWLMEEFSSRHGGPCELVSLSSPFGHDAFLKETASISTVVRDFLEGAPS